MYQQIRQQFAQSDARRDTGVIEPEDVIKYKNIRYASHPVWGLLDVYRPKDSTGICPVILSVHGGGWVYGDKDLYRFYCMSLARQGFAVVNYSYRLAPEYRFPASLEDTNTVCTWIMEHAREYGLDLGHIFAVGDSAGAHILSLYTSVLTNPSYAAEYSFRPPKGFQLQAVAFNCGAYRLKQDDPMGSLIKEILPEGKGMDRIQCLPHITEAYPPVFVMTCNGDFLKEQSLWLIDTFEEKGVDYRYRYFDPPQKTLGHVFHLNMKTKEAASCNEEQCAFFKEFL